MRIAYLAHFRGGAETGIFRKIAGQANEWDRLGATVGLFATTDAAAAADWRALPAAASVRTATHSPVSLLVERERLAGDVLSWRPDLVYARHTLFYPGLLRIERAVPLVFEINSNDLTEFASVSPRRYWYARLTRGFPLSRAAGFVFVTRELAQAGVFTRYGRPSAVIANGIRLDDVPELQAPANSDPRLVFMGHPHSPWHGLGELEDLVRAFPGWRLDVVGPAPDEFRAPPANLTAHGVLGPAAYRPIVAAADVAVGTLGLHRQHMHEASPIKLREYLASGLPAIIGYEDTDFPGGAPFLLQIPNSADGVRRSTAQIEAFVRSWMGRRVPRAAIRHLDVGEKERTRLAFFEQVLSGVRA